jgi:hypothetical protein
MSGLVQISSCGSGDKYLKSLQRDRRRTLNAK